MAVSRRLLAAVGMGGMGTVAAMLMPETTGPRHRSLPRMAAAADEHGLPKAAADELLFRFGVIADIQYCDCKTAGNFAGTEQRNYRGALAQVKRAVGQWNALSPRPLFVAQLGDLIDGQNAGGYGYEFYARLNLGFSIPIARRLQQGSRARGRSATCPDAAAPGGKWRVRGSGRRTLIQFNPLFCHILRYGAGLQMAVPESESAFGVVTGLLAECAAPILHVVGNHELYNFDWAGLKQRLNRRDVGW